MSHTMSHARQARDSSAGRVLFVDDNAAVRKAVAYQLQQAGMEVQTAVGGAEALKMLGKTVIDVVVTDVSMPRVDGLQLLAEIKRRARDLPVIMLASSSEMQEVIQAVRAGAFDYIVKDEVQIIRALALGDHRPRLGPDPLLAAVMRAVQNSRLRRANTALVASLQQANSELADERETLASTLDELRDTQVELIQAQKAASLSVLTAGVGNEINNPLASLVANLSIFGDWAESVTQLEAAWELPMTDEIPGILGECREAIQRMQTIVGQLRTFTNRSEAMDERIDLGPLLDNLVAVIGADAGKGARITISVSGQVLAKGNSGLLREVLLAAVHNSIEACQTVAVEQQPEPTIELLARQERDRVQIVVSDTGGGIDPNDLLKVFDPFFTTRGSRRTAGLGLSVARELVLAMGGDIEIDSTLGQGTRLAVGLPAWAV